LLPVTTPPTQAPRLISAGIALSPYDPAPDYASTEPRRRMLWIEFAAAPVDPEDAYFVRVLANGPDPQLLEVDENVPEQPEPALPLDAEWVRLITPGQPRDENGLRAMTRLEAPLPGARHFLVPLPESLSEASPELFGFFTYEIRLGHTETRWSTAQGRFGPALRITGVQHPAPPLVCQAARTNGSIRIRAPFATPVFEGRNMRPRVPTTALWGLLYARVRQADGLAFRNVLLLRVRLLSPQVGNDVPALLDSRILYGEGEFVVPTVEAALERLGLPADTPLTALAAELFQYPPAEDPLGAELGQHRLLRVSPLIPVPAAC
jgi:hypothetical protein